MARTSLQMNQRAIELAGHNLANVSNPAYARQRLKIQTATGVPTEDGLQGGGVEITGIEHFRDYLLDRQVANEQSVLAYLDQKKKDSPLHTVGDWSGTGPCFIECRG